MDNTLSPVTPSEAKAIYYAARGKLVSHGMKEKAQYGELPGAAPLGYRNVTDAGMSHIELDEAIAPLVKTTFELAANGELSLRGVLREVTARGLRSRSGKVLGVSGLWYLLTNPFYVGLIRHNEDLLSGRHPALVSRELFEQVQVGLHKRKKLLEKPKVYPGLGFTRHETII